MAIVETSVSVLVTFVLIGVRQLPGVPVVQRGTEWSIKSMSVLIGVIGLSTLVDSNLAILSVTFSWSAVGLAGRAMSSSIASTRFCSLVKL